MFQMIDEPGLFEPLATWESFLAQLQRMDQNDPSVRGAIMLAERVIEAKRRQGKD